MNLPLIAGSLVRFTVFEDNLGAISLVNVPKMFASNKCSSLKHHFFRSEIDAAKGTIAEHIRSKEQKADVFANGLPTEQFRVIRVMGWQSSSTLVPFVCCVFFLCSDLSVVHFHVAHMFGMFLSFTHLRPSNQVTGTCLPCSQCLCLCWRNHNLQFFVSHQLRASPSR